MGKFYAQLCTFIMHTYFDFIHVNYLFEMVSDYFMLNKDNKCIEMCENLTFDIMFIFTNIYFLFFWKFFSCFPGKLDDVKKELKQLNKQKEEALKS